MRRKDLALWAFLLVAAVWASAQAQPAPSATTTPEGQKAQGSVAPSNVPTFQFQLRTAFMLTPAMVGAIQSASQHTQDSKSSSSSSTAKESAPAWNDPIVREVSLAASLGIKIQGDQLIAMIIFMPVEFVKKTLTLLVQNQVYARSADNSIQLNTSVHTIRITLGSVFYYYPMGGDAKQGSPAVIEILINQK